MTAYFDTGVLVKSYVPEQDSAVADALISHTLEPIPFTHFHAIEIRAAVRLKRGRGEITDTEFRTALGNLQDDIDAGRLERPAYDLSVVFRKAEESSPMHRMVTLRMRTVPAPS